MGCCAAGIRFRISRSGAFLDMLHPSNMISQHLLDLVKKIRCRAARTMAFNLKTLAMHALPLS